MKSIFGLGVALGVLCGPGTALAEGTAVSVGGGLVTSSEWFVNVGLNIQGDVEFEVLPGLFVGGHGELFRMGSTSSDHASYDREELFGFGLGPTLRMSYFPTTWLEPYVTLRAQIVYGERGYWYDRTTHVTLMPGAEVGAMLRSGIFRGGLYYAADFPTANFEDFGGIRYSLYFPGVRLGLEF